MDKEEQVFDFMAAAEDTGKQLDALVKAIPNEVRETLAAEYRKSPWLATLPATADKVTAAAERAESAAAVLTKKAAFAGLLVCIAVVVVPLSTWGYAYWQTSKLRDEQAAIATEVKRLEALADTLKDDTGGGVEVMKDGDGFRLVALPPGTKVEKTGNLEDGRYAFTYIWPSATE